MNNLTDEQIDKILKDSFKQDIQISDKANAVFENFKPETIKEPTKDESNIKEEIKQTRKNVIDGLFYKRLNKFLSVAAVSLSVVIVGGTALYFNQDKMQGKQENQGNNTTIVQPTQRFVIKNEPLQYSNEQVVKEIENKFVTVYMVGNKDIGVQLKSKYWDEVLKMEVETSSEVYKVDGIEKNIKDVFIGCPEDSAIPCVFLVMEDNTGMYIDLYGYYNNVLHFEAFELEWLDNLVGFEEKTKYYSYSKTEYYTYVEAIRSDGFRKEISVLMVNNWDGREVDTYDKRNEKYIKMHNGDAVPDDGKGDFEVDGIHYNGVDMDNRYVYCMKGEFMYQDLYRIERSTGKETCIASGIGGMARNNPDGRISYYVNDDNYTIYELDDNIIYRHKDESIITEVTKVQEEKTESKNEQSEDVEDYYKIDAVGKYVQENISDSVYYKSTIEVTEQDDNMIKFEIDAAHGTDEEHVNIGSLAGTAEKQGINRYVYEKNEDGNECKIVFQFDAHRQFQFVYITESYSQNINPYAGAGVFFAGEYEYRGK